MSIIPIDGDESFYPLSKKLLIAVLEDRISDTFVSKLIWERLGYELVQQGNSDFVAGSDTPISWSKEFPHAPQVIAKRKASVFLTRSIPKEYKQLLKEELQFPGYRINELFPRRTRRATAVNWLLAWLAVSSQKLPQDGPCPHWLDIPLDPVSGHPGDPEIE